MCSVFFKPVVVRGEKMLASSLGPNSNMNPEDILIEKESSEEKKELQG
jgi:hypothetical protein